MGLIRIGVAAVAVAMLAGAGVARVKAQTETAEDGRTLAGETLETQTRFRAVWGDRAFAEWVVEHNTELHGIAGRTASATATPTVSPIAILRARLAGNPTATPTVSATASPTTAPTPTPTATPTSTGATATATPSTGMLTVVAGRGPAAEPNDELQLKALGTPLMQLGEIATTPDGSTYLTGRLGVLDLPHLATNFVRGDGILRIDPAGFVHTVVGPTLSSGDDGPATDALLTPSAAAYHANYGLIVADKTHGVRRIDAGGTIRSLVPTAPLGQCEQRRMPVLCSASDVAISPDGTLFIADSIGRAVYRVARGGRLELVTQELQPPGRLALGPDGSLYMALANKVVHLNPENGSSQTIAGSGERPEVGIGDVAGDGGPAVEARIGTIAALAVAPDGTLYLVDDTLHRVRRVGSDGIIREFSVGDTAKLSPARSVASGPDGALYVGFNDEVDRVAADGSLTRVATQAQLAPARNRTYYNDNDGVAFITGIVVASDGTLFAVDSGRGWIQRIAPDGAADHIAGAAAALQPGMSALNRRPWRIDHLLGAIDGSIYFRADNRAWRLAPDGKLSELISPATFPLGIGRDGSLYYISDNGEPGLRRRAIDGTTRMMPGFDTVFTGGSSPVKLGAIGMLAFGEDGSVYAADIVDKQVWRVKPDGTPSVVYRGDLTFIAVGPHNRLFVSATGFGAGEWSRVDAVNPDGSVVRFAGTGVEGDGGDGGPATAALLELPGGLVAGADGSLLIVDRGNNRLRRVGPEGTINTLAGLDDAGGDGQLALSAGLRRPAGLAVASDGSMLVADSENYRVRRIGADGTVSTIAGTGSNRVFFEQPARQPALGTHLRVGDVALAPDGSVYLASDKTLLREPNIVYHVVGADLVREPAPINVVGVAMSASEQLYVVGNNAVARRGKDGMWTTIAGQAHAGYNGDEMLAVNAELNAPLGVAVGPDGSVYIADTGNNRVRRITPDAHIHTVAGTGEPGYSGDGGPATLAELNGPSALAVAPDGTVFVADSHNHRVRRVKPDGIIETAAGTGWGGDGSDRGLAVQVDLNNPMGLAIGPDGSLYIADTGNSRVRRLWGAVPRR